MLTLLRVAVARLRAYLRPGDQSRDFEDELEAHLAMAEEDKIRQGLPPAEARRMARVELGGVSQLVEAGREARGLPWLDSFWLDVKLSLRMLRKSWGLTLVGGLAMTIAIVIGATVFHFLNLAFGGTLPLDEGDRVVALQIWDTKEHRRHNTSMEDLERWRASLRSVETIGAFRTVERNLVLGEGSVPLAAVGGPVEPVPVAEMTASGFQLARVPALLGRSLEAADERVGAAPVVVIGHDVWQSRLSGDPAVVGKTIRLGETIHTVVGVMPEGFAFPINHRFWTPLRADPSTPLLTTEKALVFARLAPGVTLQGAQVELTAVGLPPIAGALEAETQLVAQVEPYIVALTSDGDRGQVVWLIRLMRLMVILLLIPPCANIAILVYARTVTRQEELAARYALGASRGRLVSQLFVEMLVLAIGSAAVALGVLQLALNWAESGLSEAADGGAPFWMDFSLTLKTVLFAGGLAVFAAMAASLVPAIKATGRQMQIGLHALGSRTGKQLGATWTTLVVFQVAVSLAALPLAVEIGWGTIRKGVLGPGFAAEKYLTARLAMDFEGKDGAAEAENRRRFASLQAELVRQLEAEPGFLGTTFADLPGDEPWDTIEIEGVTTERVGIFSPASLLRINRVDDAFFDVFEIPLLSGRHFEAGDFQLKAGDAGRAVVVVNRTLVQQLLGDRNPLGRRVRYAAAEHDPAAAGRATSPWYEIVGVVEDVPAHADRGTMYQPMARGLVHPAHLAMRLGPKPSTMVDRLRLIASRLDPTLRLDEISALDEVYREQAVGNNVGASSLAAVVLSVLLLSAAGLYALTSFTVNQRRREIGIRSALGATSGRLLASIFKRTLGQFAVGALGGMLVAALIDVYLPAEVVGGWSIPGIIPAATALMVLVGILAATGPARRGLRVDPNTELREG